MPVPEVHQPSVISKDAFCLFCAAKGETLFEILSCHGTIIMCDTCARELPKRINQARAIGLLRNQEVA
jgi:hypothetical protein